MKAIITFLLLTIAINARSQHSVPANTIDTVISFSGIPLNPAFIGKDNTWTTGKPASGNKISRH